MDLKFIEKLCILIVVFVSICVATGAIIGNYVQQNKEDVKTRLKGFIDKM